METQDFDDVQHTTETPLNPHIEQLLSEVKAIREENKRLKREFKTLKSQSRRRLKFKESEDVDPNCSVSLKAILSSSRIVGRS